MQAILDILGAIGDATVALFDFLGKVFNDILYVMQITGSVVAQLPALFSWLPSELVSMLVVAFAIVVIYKLLGREG